MDTSFNLERLMVGKESKGGPTQTEPNGAVAQKAIVEQGANAVSNIAAGSARL